MLSGRPAPGGNALGAHLRSDLQCVGITIEILLIKMEVIRMMEQMFRLNCEDCGREFVVLNDEIDDEILGCPHYGVSVPVTEDTDRD